MPIAPLAAQTRSPSSSDARSPAAIAASCKRKSRICTYPILETFLDGGQLRKLTEPTRLANGRRLPGLRLDHPRLLALMHALVRFAPIAAGSVFTPAELHPFVADALACTPADYTLASLRYDLSKLRAKNLVQKLPHSRKYCLLACGYSVCLLFLKLFERIYAPLTAGLFCPFRGDPKLQHEKRS